MTSKSKVKKFSIGQPVRVRAKASGGQVVTYKGTVKKLVPRGATRGNARLTVVTTVVGTKADIVRRPFPSQCQ